MAEQGHAQQYIQRRLVTVTVTVTVYLFQQRILKEHDQPIPTLFHPASQRRPDTGTGIVPGMSSCVLFASSIVPFKI